MKIDRKLPSSYNFVQDILTPGRITCMTGGKCHGKSFFVEQLALCVSDWFDETDFLGCFTPHVKVLLLDADGNADMAKERIYDMSRALGCDTPTGYRDERLVVKDVFPSGRKIDDLCDMIYAEHGEMKPGVIIIDPVWHCVNEEDETDVEHLYEKLHGLCVNLGCAVVITHFPHGGYIENFADIKVELGDADAYGENRPSMYLPRNIRVSATTVRPWATNKISGNLPFKVGFSYPVFERAVKDKQYGPKERHVEPD